jgi:hypothetical protein
MATVPAATVGATPSGRFAGLRLAPGAAMFATYYLRAAQAYMLISMPTGTSTIFGHFQAIRDSPKLRHDRHSRYEVRPNPKCRKTYVSFEATKSANSRPQRIFRKAVN